MAICDWAQMAGQVSVVREPSPTNKVCEHPASVTEVALAG